MVFAAKTFQRLTNKNLHARDSVALTAGEFRIRVVQSIREKPRNLVTCLWTRLICKGLEWRWRSWYFLTDAVRSYIGSLFVERVPAGIVILNELCSFAPRIEQTSSGTRHFATT